MNTAKVAIRLSPSIAAAVNASDDLAHYVVHHVMRDIATDGVHIRRVNGVAQYAIVGDVLYAAVEDLEDRRNIRGELLQGSPHYDHGFIVIDDALLRELGFTQSLAQLIDEGRHYAELERIWQEERMKRQREESRRATEARGLREYGLRQARLRAYPLG